MEMNTLKDFPRKTQIAFGIAPAPAIFQKNIDKILHGINGVSKSIVNGLK